MRKNAKNGEKWRKFAEKPKCRDFRLFSGIFPNRANNRVKVAGFQDLADFP